MNRPRRLEARDYTVGWICALPVELAAAQEMFDEVDEPIVTDNLDPSLYSLGRIGVHNVVITCLPAGSTGTQSAATVAARMKSRFTLIRFGLMVGIGGGVPSVEFDIRLGDVVISQPYQQHGGVVQYDFGKTGPGGQTIRTGWLNAPPPVLLSAIVEQRARHFRRQSNLEHHLSRLQRLPYFKREAAGPDVLFQATYEHPGGPTCELCANTMKIWRPGRSGPGVGLHYGTIASGNQVIKDGVRRDEISKELGGVMCFEMEAAGLMNDLPCLVIRGICDYADSHKNKRWQPYAAATAAACAKEILSIIPGVPGPTTARPVTATDSGKSRIEIKLDQLMKELQLGYKFPAQFVQDLETDLLDDNITEVDVEENKDFIAEWLRNTEDDGWLDERDTIGQNRNNMRTSGAQDQPAGTYESLTQKGLAHPNPEQAYCETAKGDDEENPYDDSDHLSSAETEVPDDLLKVPPSGRHTTSANPRSHETRRQPPAPPEAKRNPIYAVRRSKPSASESEKKPLRKSRRRRHRSLGRGESEDDDRYMNQPRSSEAYSERRSPNGEVPERPRSNPFYPSYNNLQQREEIRYGGDPEYQTAHSGPSGQHQYRSGPYGGYDDRANDRYRNVPRPPRADEGNLHDANYDRYVPPPPISYNRQQGGPGPHNDTYQQYPYGNTPGGKTFHFSSNGNEGGAKGFNFSNADDIFAQFLRADADNNIYDEFFGGGFPSKSSTRKQEISIVEKPLPVSLEELFNGVTKKMKINRKTYDTQTGRTSVQDRILEIPIKKGLKAGSKIKFADIGDQTAEGTQDMHFIITEV
jgi:nucleoside phosphorylase